MLMLARLVVRLFFSPEGYVVHKRRSVVQISERYFHEVYLRAFTVLGVCDAFFLVGSLLLLIGVNRGNLSRRTKSVDYLTNI